MYRIKKSKGSPYSITECMVSELIPVLGSQPEDDASHEHGSLATIYRISYDNLTITPKLQLTYNRKSNLQNISRRTQGFLRYESLAKS